MSAREIGQLLVATILGEIDKKSQVICVSNSQTIARSLPIEAKIVKYLCMHCNLPAGIDKADLDALDR